MHKQMLFLPCFVAIASPALAQGAGGTPVQFGGWYPIITIIAVVAIAALILRQQSDKKLINAGLFCLFVGIGGVLFTAYLLGGGVSEFTGPYDSQGRKHMINAALLLMTASVAALVSGIGMIVMFFADKKS